MLLLYGALPLPNVKVPVTCCALVAHRDTYAHPRCRTSQYRMAFIHFSVSSWNDLADPVFDCVGPAGFLKPARANVYLSTYS